MDGLPSVDEIAVMHGRELDAALRACEQARRQIEATIAAITARCDQTMLDRGGVVDLADCLVIPAVAFPRFAGAARVTVIQP